jgi:hypothetical protein
MNGPFSYYAWGDAYETMHDTMYRTKNRDPSPSSVSDDQLAAMWERAYEAYQTTLGVWTTIAGTEKRLQERLAEAREADDRAAETDLLERLAAVMMTAEAETALEARLKRQVEWLETIDAEYERRPWLSAATADPWAIEGDVGIWSEVR